MVIDKLKIAKFWRRMSEIFTYKWTSTNGEKPISGSLWIDFINALSQQDIERGIALIIETFKPDAWPPSIIEFKNLCNGITPTALGLPDIDQAFYQALSGKYKSDVVRYAAIATGTFDLKRGVQTDSELKKRFEYNYAIMVERLSKGEPLDKPINPALERLKEAGYRFTDDLINQEAEKIKATGKTGYMAFKELKDRLGGVR